MLVHSLGIVGLEHQAVEPDRERLDLGAARAAGAARIELTTPAAVAEEFEDAHADPAGRIEYLAVVEFKVMSLPETARLLRPTAGLRVEDRRVVVSAPAAFNATLVFVE